MRDCRACPDMSNPTQFYVCRGHVFEHPWLESIDGAHYSKSLGSSKAVYDDGGSPSCGATASAEPCCSPGNARGFSVPIMSNLVKRACLKLTHRRQEEGTNHEAQRMFVQSFTLLRQPDDDHGEPRFVSSFSIMASIGVAFVECTTNDISTFFNRNIIHRFASPILNHITSVTPL